MPLVFNGTTIPTNVANALMYNGTSVTQVVYNGTTVWTQSLSLSNGFSGSSLGSTGYGPMGYEMSGGWLWRMRWSSSAYSSSWITVNSNGTFSGNSPDTTGLSAFGIYTSSNTFWHTPSTSGTVTYTFSSKSFSGTTTGSYGAGGTTYGETSSGLLRYRISGYFNTSGPWISLT